MGRITSKLPLLDPPIQRVAQHNRLDRALAADLLLGGFRRLRREEFEIDDASYERLATLVEQWRARASEMAADGAASNSGKPREPQ